MTKKLGVTLLALCCALGLCAVTALAANGNNAPATPTVEPQAPVSLAHFRQSGADVQQSIDNGKSWEIYSPITNFLNGLKPKWPIFKNWWRPENGQRQRHLKRLPTTEQSSRASQMVKW